MIPISIVSERGTVSIRTFTFITPRVLMAAVAMLIATQVVLPASGSSLSGVVQTGGTASSRPLPDVNVTLLEATSALPTTVGQATSDASGRFAIPYRQRTSASIFYLRADLGAGIEFVTVLGPKLPASTTINELTTVAAAYSLAQFYRTGVISGNAFGLLIAAGMNDNIVASVTGASSSVLLSSPNADETNSLRSTRSLANLLAACLDDPEVTATLFELTTPPGGTPPHNTAQAFANLARNPGQNVDAIYLLTQLSDLYSPPLEIMPDAWTVTVKVNDSGDDAMLFGGPGNLVFDARGYAWITNNTVQGTPNSSRTMMVLKPNGKPADGKRGTPVSPLTGGGLLGGGYGITIDPQGSVWEGNFGWGDCSDCKPSLDGNGSVSRFTKSGAAVSQPNGYQGGPVRAMGMASDVDGNIWISSNGNDSVYVFRHGNPHQSVGLQQYEGSQPFDLRIAADGTAWVTNGGGFDGIYPSSVARYALANGVLQQQFLHFMGQAIKALALDSQGNAWVASQGDNLVYLVGPDGSEIGHFSGGGIDGPWGITVDGEDNVWVSNFGPLQPGSNFTSGRLTKLCGTNPATRPPGTNVGDPISPATGYTVQSAGSQVLLHNGDPLYGPGAAPSFAPMMRQTSVVVDQAGNVWSVNNWKPDFDIDIAGNPGADGIIIFVGLAPPLAQDP
jgi:streptogramin lyase